MSDKINSGWLLPTHLGKKDGGYGFAWRKAFNHDIAEEGNYNLLVWNDLIADVTCLVIYSLKISSIHLAPIELKF